MSDFRVGRPDGDGEVGALAAILAQVFTVRDGVTATREWMQRTGMDNVRAVRRGADVVGGLLVLPMGQWFGGRPVRMAGIAGVGVAPEHRARGAAGELMRETLRGLRADGFPISTLYPATQSLYRRVGYERAGTWTRVNMPTKAIDVVDRGLAVRRAGPADHAAIEACWRLRAAGSNGPLDRSGYIWQRIRGEEGKVHGYVVEEAGTVTGYVHFQHEPTPEFLPNLVCTDLVAVTPAAARRLLGFFADHRSLSRAFDWAASPADPFLFHLVEQRDLTVRKSFTWMLRLLDVAAAFEARGWPASVSAELHLDVRDDVLPENAGRWRVTIEGGRAEASRGGDGCLRCDVRGLASLWSGYLAPSDAAACGVLEGSAADVAAAAPVFAGPAPWMADHF